MQKEGVEFLDVGVVKGSIDNDMLLVDNSLDAIEIEVESLN